jgi:hypothetical protein
MPNVAPEAKREILDVTYKGWSWLADSQGATEFLRESTRLVCNRADPVRNCLGGKRHL